MFKLAEKLKNVDTIKPKSVKLDTVKTTTGPFVNTAPSSAKKQLYKLLRRAGTGAAIGGAATGTVAALFSLAGRGRRQNNGKSLLRNTAYDAAEGAGIGALAGAVAYPPLRALELILRRRWR